MASNDLSYLKWPKCIQIQNQSSQQLLWCHLNMRH